SNGYLFSESVVLQAVNDWNLKSIQITLDGTEDVYNRTKNYINKEENAFYRVIHNISLLLKENIYVRIRLNMVSGSYEDMKNLIDFLFAQFGNSNYLKIYAVEVFDANKNDLSKKNHMLWKEVSQINRYIDEKGFGYSHSLSQKLRVNYCMADSDNAITILPNGNLGKCEYYSDSDIWGNIYCDTYNEKVIEAWKESYADMDSCKECFFFPECLHLKKCPEAFYCNGNVEYKKRQIQKQIEKIYYEMCLETQDMGFC
ncbi:MAG: hypothetical protein IKJ01_09000, partial [Lachnospiraceae bacterium]|nr:hypothetical protein [Lachnospiraceae bacterium]